MKFRLDKKINIFKFGRNLQKTFENPVYKTKRKEDKT